MTKVPATRTRKPRAVKSAPVDNVIVTLQPEHLGAVQKAHQLLATKDLELKAAQHFLEKINEEIAETYKLPEKFTIDLYSGEITEG